MSAAALTVREANLIVRDALKDKSYRAYPIGQEAGRYLRIKRKRLTEDSYRDYESCLDKLARHFLADELSSLEPPVGTERLEEFLEDRWGKRAPRTYNKNLSILKDFFRWAVMDGRMYGNPTLRIERSRPRAPYREVFNPDQLAAIIAGQVGLRDRICCRLLLDYGIRKGALRAIQFRHFDHYRKRLTIFTKGQKVRDLPIPDPAFWFDLERLIQDREAKPDHYLLNRRKAIPRKGKTSGSSPSTRPSRWDSTGRTTGGTGA